jgi:hypothetical protein
MATLTKSDYYLVWKKALAAGEEAARNTVPTPMMVVDANLDGSPRAGGKQWAVPSGVCGFGLIRIKPANGGFAKWLKAEGHARIDSYYGGLVAHAHPQCTRGTPACQSMEINAAYARAVAETLRKYGIPAGSEARMD